MIRGNTMALPGHRLTLAQIHQSVTLTRWLLTTIWPSTSQEVLFGGYGSSVSRLNDTWEYNGTWQQVNTAQTPPGRFHHSMAYDTRRHVMVLFGGVDSANAKLNDTLGIRWHYIASNRPTPIATRPR